MLHLEHKKGNPNQLDGRVTVYAKISADPSDLIGMKNPIVEMVHNSLLVAQGNYREQFSFKDFLKSEIGLSDDGNLDERLADMIDRMGGIESALDPQKLKDRLENMGDFEELIPTPARIVPFHSETEILNQEGDVFFVGTFKNISNAVLSINAVPIVYQARFREQEMQQVRNEIESLISQIEQTDVPIPEVAKKSDASTEALGTEARIMKEFIPNMIYSRKEKAQFDASVMQLRIFLSSYRFKDDIDSIVSLIADNEHLGEKENKLLELYAKKIAAVNREDFSTAEKCTTSIQRLSDVSENTSESGNEPDGSGD